MLKRITSKGLGNAFGDKSAFINTSNDNNGTNGTDMWRDMDVPEVEDNP